MTNTAEQIAILINQMGQIQEASAKGFKGNTKALLLIGQMREVFDRLEVLADEEFWS